MAMQLIDRFAGSFDPQQYEDTYRKALLEIIDRKRKGEEIHVEPAREPGQAPDLIEALRASLEAAQGRRRDDGRTKRDAQPRRARSRKQAARR
jgi:DNA end-binding protein Ku